MGHAIRESSLSSGYLPAITGAVLYSLEFDQLECNYKQYHGSIERRFES
jgi:hypothetical protein